MTPRIRSAHGGVRLAYAEQGSGLPVIFLHGFSDSRRSFEGLFHHLPNSLRAIAPSLRALNIINYAPAIEQAARDSAKLDGFRLRLSGALDLYAL